MQEMASTIQFLHKMMKSFGTQMKDMQVGYDQKLSRLEAKNLQMEQSVLKTDLKLKKVSPLSNCNIF